MRITYKNEILLAGFVLFAVILPFSHRAIYMDEHLYLGLAQSTLIHPLHPMDTPWLYFGTWFPKAEGLTHPPLGEYHLALLYWLFGSFSEPAFRILFGAPYAIAAVVGFYGLAVRWASHPFALSLLFAVCPPFFVMVPTLMMDLPSVGCLLLGLRIFFSASETAGQPASYARLATSSVCFLLALGMAYTAAIPLAALFVWCLLERKRLAQKMAVLVPFLGLALWLAAMTVHFREFLLKGVMLYVLSQFKPAHNIVATLSFLGGLAVFPWSLAMLKQRRLTLLAVSIVCSALTVFSRAWPSGITAVLYFLMASWGSFLILSVVWVAGGKLRPCSDWDSLFLSVWFLGSLIFFILAADMMTARYLLLSLPPLYLLLFKDASLTVLKRTIVATVMLSICLAIADYRFVGGYRAWVRDNLPIFQAAGYRVWSGTESGLRFYLHQYGAEELDSRDLRPRATDLVIQHSELFQMGLAPDLAAMLVQVKDFQIEDSFPLRTFNGAAGAGFHDSRIGLIPYNFSDAPLDSIRVTQVSPFATQLPVRPPVNEFDAPVWTPNGVELNQNQLRDAFDIPSLLDVQWKATLVGSGTVEMGLHSITLLRPKDAAAVWRNFRIVPKGY
jgi:4-amino-4-deoxy-L-arabinose transferase-like glycosyltransferase